MFRPWETVQQSDNVEVISLSDSENQQNDDSDTNFQNEKYSYTHLSADTKKIILNVYNTLHREENVNPLARTAVLTGVPRSTVHDIVKNRALQRKRRWDSGTSLKIADYDIHLIRRKIYAMYKENEVPTVEALRNRLERDETGIQCSVSTLKRFLKKNGFHYKTVDKRQVIMDTPRLQRWRHEYLVEINKFREQGRKIYYLDETWYDTHDMAKKGWSDDTSKCAINTIPSRGKRIVVLHCGSEDGWVDGALLLSSKNLKDCNVDYHDNMTSDMFEEWFRELIPKLHRNSVIVLDNASYHSRQIQKVPNTSSTKATIQKFLLEHDLFYEDNYTKGQLLEVLRTGDFKKQYHIDEQAKTRGLTVLRLPPYHCIFNPIELIWGQLKKKIRRRNVFPKFDSRVVELIRSELNNITPSYWRMCIQHVISVEKNYFDVARLDNDLIINLEDSDDSEDSIET